MFSLFFAASTDVFAAIDVAADIPSALWRRFKSFVMRSSSWSVNKSSSVSVSRCAVLVGFCVGRVGPETSELPTS